MAATLKPARCKKAVIDCRNECQLIPKVCADSEKKPIALSPSGFRYKSNRTFPHLPPPISCRGGVYSAWRNPYLKNFSRRGTVQPLVVPLCLEQRRLTDGPRSSELAPLPVSILPGFQSDARNPIRDPPQIVRPPTNATISIAYAKPATAPRLASILHYPKPWARFEWMDRLRVT